MCGLSKVFRNSMGIWDLHESLCVCVSMCAVCRFSLMFAMDCTTWQGKMTVALRSDLCVHRVNVT